MEQYAIHVFFYQPKAYEQNALVLHPQHGCGLHEYSYLQTTTFARKLHYFALFRHTPCSMVDQKLPCQICANIQMQVHALVRELLVTIYGRFVIIV